MYYIYIHKKVPLHRLHIIISTYKVFLLRIILFRSKEEAIPLDYQIDAFPLSQSFGRQVSRRENTSLACFLSLLLSMCRQTDGLDADDERVCYMDKMSADLTIKTGYRNNNKMKNTTTFVSALMN